MIDSHARQDWDDVYKRLVIVQLLKWLVDDMCNFWFTVSYSSSTSSIPVWRAKTTLT
jgi:hypothetical protein